MKTQKIIIFIILMLTILFNINTVFASSLDYDSEESTQEISETSLDEETTEISEELPSTDFLASGEVTNVSTVNTISQMNLKLNNILNIILIAIGVLLILFAIAILIRLKK